MDEGSKNADEERQQDGIWLDCDTGHDDAFAILLAAHADTKTLLGISTVHGNASVGNTTINTLRILEAIGRSDIPVYPGASKPLHKPGAHFAPDIHGTTGLDGTTLLPAATASAITSKPAVDAMARALLSTPPQTAWFVATGALTNVAMAVTKYPELVEHLAGLSIMGGAVGGGFTNAKLGMLKLDEVAAGELERREDQAGNWTPWAEFNIWCDPEAAETIFSNTALSSKTTLITLDLTHQFLATRQKRDLILGKGNSKVRWLFHEILIYFATTYAEVFGLVEGPPLHDPLAVVEALCPEFLDDDDGERYHVQIITGHPYSTAPSSVPEQIGRTIIAPTVSSVRYTHGQPRDGGGGVRIPWSLNEEKVWKMLDRALDKAELVSPLGVRLGMG